MDNLKFIKKAKKIHGDKYDYSKVEYNGAHEKVCIICPEHGEFWQSPSNHTHKTKPHGCPKCNGGLSLTRDYFIQKAKEIHGNKYDYSKVEYKNNSTKVCIICSKHGEFRQTPAAHLRGQGCYLCNGGVNLTTDEFIKKAVEIHKCKYSYDNVQYINSHSKVAIKCNECGNIFSQTPNDHLSGSGCPFCKKWLLEERVKKVLESKGICFIRQCNKKILNWIGNQRLDFFLPDYNVAIECQGEQHFKPKKDFGGENEFIKTVLRDKLKKEKCSSNGVSMLYFSNVKTESTFLGEKIYKQEEDLLKRILKNERKLL